MNRARTVILIFSILSFTQFVNAQDDYDFYLQKARQRLAEGDCTRAEASYNTYKDMAHKSNKEIERLIEECKTGGSSGFGETGTTNGHDYVDLGLPSGTLWATCNIGTSKPEGYGNYYAWGETSTKSTYNWSTYKYANGAYGKLTKYCSKSDYGNNGFTDNLTTLQTGDDPATANWGRGWQTPSDEQWEELLEYTDNEWTGQGRLFTSKKNGQSLFLPAAGFRWDAGHYLDGSTGYYLDSSNGVDVKFPDHVWCFSISSDGTGASGNDRCCGFSVRPVREK